MASFPFRPPQFSDDGAWLPDWIQFHQAETRLHESSNGLLHQSFQNMDPFKTDNDPNVLSGTECRFNCHLYLSGEENSQATLTPSCEKALHFNLHLSTDGMSSVISSPLLVISEYDKVNSAKGKLGQSGETLHGLRNRSQPNVDHNASAVDHFSSFPNEGGFCDACNRARSYNSNAKQDILEMFNSKDTECDDIDDAVELAIGASEALVIYDLMQSGSVSDALSATAVLEIALRVKHARLEGLQDSVCCLVDAVRTVDILSDLCDSDMEEAYEDVGLPTVFKGPSISRVKDTPMMDTHSELEREVQSELRMDQGTYYDNSFAAKPLEDNLGTSKLDIPTELIDTEKQEKLYGSPRLDLIVATSYQSQRGNSDDLQEEDACVGIESKGAKTIPKPFTRETSYFSESADIAPDQNSFVHNHNHCSKASESSLHLEVSIRAASGESLADQSFVKDPTLSFIDPLCSIVPCSISAEIDGSSLATDNDHPRMLTAVKNLTPCLDVPSEDVQTISAHNDGSVIRKEHNQLSVDDNGRNPIICRKLTTLRPYSVGFSGNPSASFKRSFDYELARPEECSARLLSDEQERSPSNFPKGNDVVKPPPAISISHCTTSGSNGEKHEMRMLSVEQLMSSANTPDGKVHKKPVCWSTLSYATATNNEKIKGYTERNAESGAGLCDHLQDRPASPLVLCHKARRRFKAPEVPVTDFSTANQMDGQVPGSDMVHQKSSEIPPDEQNKFFDDDVSVRKRVHFSDVDVKIYPRKNLKRMLPSCRIRSSRRVRNKPEVFDEVQGAASQEVKERLTNCRMKGRKRAIFQGLEFLLTGLSKNKEKEIEGLLQKHGGIVLSDVPATVTYPKGRRSSRSVAQRLPVVLCTKTLQTTKFLYGCAVNAFLLKVGWAYDSIQAGSVLPPDQYIILSNQANRKPNKIGNSVYQNCDEYIFDRVGIMVLGKHNFCSKLVKLIKHGGGCVYKSLQWLVQSLESKKICFAAIVAENENHATRHLRKCASEQKIPVMPGSWVINSLLDGKLLPFKENFHSSHSPAIKVPQVSVSLEWSQEI